MRYDDNHVCSHLFHLKFSGVVAGEERLNSKEYP